MARMKTGQEIRVTRRLNGISTDYVACSAYVVTQKLLGGEIVKDKFAEHHDCNGCGAPAGYRCIDTRDIRFLCREIAPGDKVTEIHRLQAAEWQRTNPDESEWRRLMGLKNE